MDVQLGPSSSSPHHHSLSAGEGRSQVNLMAPGAGLVHGYPASAASASSIAATHSPLPPPGFYHAHDTRKMRKRKAESQDTYNERLSKRLSLLNLEQNGQKLYVPVESAQLRPTDSASLKEIPEGEIMQLDDSKHKVYIYDLDAELSDSGESDDGKLVFLPDIKKHLQQNRIPRSVLANKDGELAGMQMVLYSEPTSLTVPAEQDSVRKAVLEARARVRRKQRSDQDPVIDYEHDAPPTRMDNFSDCPLLVPNGLKDLANDAANYPAAATANGNPGPVADEDPDAMDVD